MTNFKSYEYEKHSRDICYGVQLVQVLIPYITHSQNERYIWLEVSAETLKTTETAETTTSLDRLETDVFNKPGTEESAETLSTTEAPETVDTTGKCVPTWFSF